MSKWTIPDIQCIQLPEAYLIDFNHVFDRKKRNKQRAAFAGTNKTNHDIKWFRWKHIEAQHMFIQETDGN